MKEDSPTAPVLRIGRNYFLTLLYFSPRVLSLSESFLTSQIYESSKMEGYEMSGLPEGVLKNTFLESIGPKEINMITLWTSGSGIL